MTDINIGNAELVTINSCCSSSMPCTSSVTVVTDDSVWFDGGGEASTTSSIALTADGSFAPPGVAFLVADGPAVFGQGMSGSHTALADGSPAFVGAGAATVGTNAAGQVVITVPASGGGSGSVSQGAFAARPAPTGSGALYLCSDTPLFSYDDPATSQWLDWVGPSPVVPPMPLSSYTFSGALVGGLAQGDGFKLVNMSNAQGLSNAIVTGSFSGAITGSAWAVDVAFDVSAPFGTYPSAGVFVSNGAVHNTSVQYVFTAWSNNGQWGLHVVHATVGGNRTAVAAEGGGLPVGLGGLIRLRILNDGSRFHYQTSADGRTWVDWYVEAALPGTQAWGVAFGNDFNASTAQVVATVYQNRCVAVLQSAVSGTSGNGVSPILVTTVGPHGLQEVDQASVFGVVGNTAANAVAYVNVVNATQFQMLGLTGNGAYVSGGTVTGLTR